MAVITVNQIIDNIDSFISNVKKLSKSYYVSIGKPDSWPDDADPPTANASVEQTELSIYRDLVYGKLIFDSDVSYMIRTISWTSNTVYAQYSQYDPDLLSKNFYAITDAGEVYKCVYNNSNTASTVKPALTTTSGTFTTGDGYIWKYMFTVDQTANTKFATASYTPVTVNNAVESSATPGTIDYIRLTNSGNNYDVFTTGFVQSVANNGYSIFLANTADSNDNYYSGSTLYLKAGGGAGQIRNVTQYSGQSKMAIVDQPFDVYTNLNLSAAPSISVGDVVSQNSVDIAHLYDKGSFQSGDTVVQTDTGAVGVIVFSNATHFVVSKNNASSNFSLTLPLYNTIAASSLKTGNVTILSGNNQVAAAGGTAFTTDYASGDYIAFGASGNTNIRRITAVNSTVIIVDNTTPFTTNLTSVPHYSVPNAAVPDSLTVVTRYGAVSYVNLTGVKIAIANVTPSGAQFIPGEKVFQVDANNTTQGANAIISFSNNSSMELSSVVGTVNTGLYVLGQSSNVKAYISTVTSFPNITLENPVGDFRIGQTINVGNTSTNATVLSITTTPSSLTEYVVSPKVSITGDGNGALAYAYVDTTNTNPSRSISSIVMINHGTGYSQANVTITSNGSYGSGATAVAGISPITGHGSNTYIELGAKYAGISLTFANGENEAYKFPISGKFRRVAILEDPTFEDAILTLDTFDRVKLYLGTNNGTSFTPGEVAYQANTGKAGIVVFSNSSYLELKGVLDTAGGLPFYTYATNNANTTIVGLTSNAHANVLTTAANNTANSTVNYFTLLSNVESISEITSGATATISEIISNTSIRVSNIKGHFNANDTIYDPVTNAYANVVSITISNGAIDATTNFGHRFTQTCRVPLTSNTGAFQQFEKVVQAATDATGTVLTFNSDRDVVVSSNAVAVNNGDELNSTSGGTAIALYSNGVYIKCVGASGTFGVGDTLYKGNTTIGTIDSVYPVLRLYNVYNMFSSGNNMITGQTSGATGRCTLPNTIWHPDMVRESGLASYIENILPFERSNTSVEKINIIIKF